MAPFGYSSVESGRNIQLATVDCVIRIPAGTGECRRAQNTCGPRHKAVAVRDALGYTFAIPRPAGFAGLGAHAWRNAETEEKQPSVRSRAVR
jgi:hypothetical protein